MSEKHSISIDTSLYNEISEYCKENGLKICSFCADILKKGLAAEKWGDIPFGVITINNPSVKEIEEDGPNQFIPIEILQHAEKVLSQKEIAKDEIKPLIKEDKKDEDKTTLCTNWETEMEQDVKASHNTEEIVTIEEVKIESTEAPRPRKRRLS